MNIKLENSLAVLANRRKNTDNTSGHTPKKERNQVFTHDELLLQHYQEQISKMHESNFQQQLKAKLDSGLALTAEEEQYLQETNPEALEEHKKLEEEVAAYRKQLQNCRTKKDVEKLKLYKMGQFMSEVNTVANDPRIPKSKKKALLEQILKRTAAIEKEHNDYTKTPEYQTKPDKEPYEDAAPSDVSENTDTGSSEDNSKDNATDISANTSTDTTNGISDGTSDVSSAADSSNPDTNGHVSGPEEPDSSFQSVQQEINRQISNLHKKVSHIDASI